MQYKANGFHDDLVIQNKQVFQPTDNAF